MRSDGMTLSERIDVVSAQVADGIILGTEARDMLVGFLLDRQKGRGRHAGLMTLWPGEFERGVRLFSGERLRTRRAAENVLTLEAVRLLAMLAGDRADVRDAMKRSSAVMARACFAASHCILGECAHASIAYMRSAASDRSGDLRRWIARHVQVIRAQRDGAGRWTRFPFYYTLLGLLEVGTPAARAELDYARCACERASMRAASEVYVARRQRIVRRVLERGENVSSGPCGRPV